MDDYRTEVLEVGGKKVKKKKRFFSSINGKTRKVSRVTRTRSSGTNGRDPIPLGTYAKTPTTRSSQIETKVTTPTPQTQTKRETGSDSTKLRDPDVVIGEIIHRRFFPGPSKGAIMATPDRDQGASRARIRKTGAKKGLVAETRDQERKTRESSFGRAPARSPRRS